MTANVLVFLRRVERRRRPCSIKTHDTANPAGVFLNRIDSLSCVSGATEHTQDCCKQYHYSRHRGIWSGAIGSGIGLLIGGSDCKYAKTALRSSSVMLRYQFHGIGGRIGLPAP